MPIYSSRVWCNTIRSLVVAAISIAAASPQIGAQSAANLAATRIVTAGGELDNYLRYLQSLGLVPVTGWELRPFSVTEADTLTHIKGAHPWRDAWLFAGAERAGVRALPIVATAQVNSAFPWGGNDGALWAGRGLTTSLQAGLTARFGPLSIVLDPIVFRAENTPFALEPNGQTGIAAFADGEVPGGVDRPQRFGSKPYERFDWGQSTVRLDGWGVTAGVSSANQYWGPATVFPVILGNNAAGVPHVFLGTARPAPIYIGHVTARVEYGLESQSAYSPVVGPATFVDATRPGTRRFMSGVVATFTPGALPGLDIGAARYFHQAWTGHVGAAELRSPFEGLVKSSLPTGPQPSGSGNADALKNQLASVFARWVLPHSGFEVYGEYGHEDHNYDTRDLLEEPDHSRIAMMGFRKAFVRDSAHLSAFRAEYIDATEPSLKRHRGEGNNYAHTVLRQGHTQLGQLLGANIGVGSAGGAVAAWETYSPTGRTTWYVQRLVQDNRATLLTYGLPDTHADQLFATIGFERRNFMRPVNLVYGAALTEGKRGPTLAREMNASVTIGVITPVP